MTSPGEKVWPGRVAMVGASTAIGCFVLLHMWMGHFVDPLRRPVSLYALEAPGSVLFPLGVLGVAVAAMALSLPRPVRGAQVRCILTRASLGAAGALLVLVALFPTDAGYRVASWSGEIHRYAAGGAFLLLTVAGLAHAAHGVRHRGPVRAIGVTAVISAVTFVVIVFNTFAPVVLHAQSWSGIPQRILLLAHAVMLMFLAAPLGTSRRVGVLPGMHAAPRKRESMGANMHVLSGTDNR